MRTHNAVGGWAATARGYGIALGAVVAMALLRSLLLRDLGSRAPFVTLLVAVIVAALYGGVGPGFFATGLSVAYVVLLVFPQTSHGEIYLANETSVVLFAALSIVLVLICGAKNRAERMARSSAEESVSRERELAGLERRHREVLDGMGDVLCILDKDWRYTYVNRRAEELLRTPFAEIAGKTIWEAFSALIGTPLEQQFRLAATDRRPREFEYLSERLQRWLEIRIYPSDDGYAIYASDVTDRKTAALALEAKEKQLRLVTEAAPALIAYVDTNERYVFVNRAYEVWFARSEAEIVGRTMAEMLGATYEKSAKHIRAALAGEPVLFETKASNPDGSTRWMQVSYAPDTDAEGVVRGFVSVVTDVTNLRQADASLRASERLAAKRLAELDNLYRLAPAGLGFIDRELKFVRINEALAETLGWGAGEPVGRTVGEVLGDQTAVIEPALLQVLKTGQPLRNRPISLRTRPGGEERSYIASYEPVFDARHELLGISAVVQDITSLRDSERALELSEERYRTVVESAAEGIWAVDSEFVVTFANQAMGAILGCQPSDLVGRKALDFVMDEDVDMALETRKKQRPGLHHDLDIRLKRADGSIVWARTHSLATFDEQGRRIQSMAFVTDITEQKRLEDQQKMLVDASHVLSSSLDYEGTLKQLAKFTVPALADWCSLHIREGDAVKQLAIAHTDPEQVRWAEELQQKYPTDLQATSGVGNVLRTGKSELYPEIPPAMLEAAAIDEERRLIVEMLGLTSAMIVPLITRGRTVGAMTLVTSESKRRYTHADLAFAEQLANRAALAVDNARLFTAAQQEISERIEAEREVRRLNAELEERVDERTKALRLALTDLEGFCYTVSHDLRAPMRSISGNSMIMLEEYGKTLDQEGREILLRLSASAAKMGTLIDDLLEFSRLGRAGMSRTPIDLTAMTHAILEDMHGVDSERVCIKVEQGLEAEADPIMVRLVLQNLLENAVKYSSRRDHARIEVGKTVQSGHTAFFVRDNGIGFDMDYVEKIFQPFERLHRESEFPGTGIGLANVRRIVMRHGGRVWAESKPGQGATFYFTLSSDRDADAHIASNEPSFLA